MRFEFLLLSLFLLPDYVCPSANLKLFFVYTISYISLLHYMQLTEHPPRATITRDKPLIRVMPIELISSNPASSATPKYRICHMPREPYLVHTLW